MKEKLEETGRFGAVRVTPDATATGDLYVIGRIEESNAVDVEIDIEVIDISGKNWLTDSYEHEVPENFHKDQRNKGKDSYDPIFVEIAEDIIAKLKKRDYEELEDLRYLADLRFGANFSEQTFMEYMKTRNGRFSLTAKPSDNDPMLQRVKAIRVRDQLFVDGLQDNYVSFSAEMNDSYLMWQEQSHFEVLAEREARSKTIKQRVAGGLLIGLAVLSGVSAAKSDKKGTRAVGTTGAILGGIAGASILSESFKTSKKAERHRDIINEFGQSIDMSIAPQVIAFEKESVELTGDAKEQFKQWRAFLQRIYEEEKTPEVQL